MVPPTLVFQGWDRICLPQIGPFSWIQKLMYLSKENYLCYKPQILAHCFPGELSLLLKEILPANGNLQVGERLTFCQIGLFSWVEETYVPLQRNPSMLKAASSSTWFPCENWISLGRKYFLLMQSDQWEKTWLWCHSEPTSPGTGNVHRQLLP
jgi:hypothetical protein